MNLQVENLFVRFGETMVLSGVNFELKPGEIVGLIGQNGCGKTTFLNAISGFVPVESGSILLNASDVTRLPAYRRAQMGLGRAFQNPGIFREMSVYENLLMAYERSHRLPWWWQIQKKYRHQAQYAIENALQSVDLLAHRDSMAGVLSGGQARLLELLRLKIGGGDLLLIDEPTAGVSPVMKEVLQATLKDLARDQHRSLLIVEHDLKFLEGIVDRVVVFVDGRVYLEGLPADILRGDMLKEVYFGSLKN